MNNETVNLLVKFLEAMAHHSREYALKLKAIEHVARKYPEIFNDYESHLDELRGGSLTAQSLERTEEVLAKLRAALLQDHE
jgi:hypothetical protein